MTVKVGFIGVGGIAEHHMKTLQNIERASIAAVFDIQAERAEEIARQYGAVSYPGVAELLDSGAVDAIFVCTPPFARDGLEEEAAKRGIHVLAEKPVALRMDQALEKEKAITDAGVIHSSGYCLRYHDIVQQAKAYLADKQIDLIMASRFTGTPGAFWWTKMEMSGGQLVEMATHQLDLIRYLAGEFREVRAIQAQRSLRNIDPQATAYDVGTVNFVMQSGAIGNISTTCLAKYVGSDEVKFYGNGFYVSINGSELRIVDDRQDLRVNAQTDPYYEQDKAFVEAVRQRRQELVFGSYSDAVRTLEVTLAANRSASEQRTVTFS